MNVFHRSRNHANLPGPEWQKILLFFEGTTTEQLPRVREFLLHCFLNNLKTNNRHTGNRINHKKLHSLKNTSAPLPLKSSMILGKIPLLEELTPGSGWWTGICTGTWTKFGVCIIGAGVFVGIVCSLWLTDTCAIPLIFQTSPGTTNLNMPRENTVMPFIFLWRLCVANPTIWIIPSLLVITLPYDTKALDSISFVSDVLRSI